MTLSNLFSLKAMESLQIWGCNSFWSNFIVFNGNTVAGVIAVVVSLMLTLGAMAHSHCVGLGQGQGPRKDGFQYYVM